ncbi:MAG: DNA polymerase III subunit delta [Bryobacteraceae bacterium]|nr:DNA polymerase III subunit delta [Bryobacteraceae bacterium]
MTPAEFLQSLASRPLAPAYLFLGPEAFDRDRCRKALVERALPAEDREAGMIRHDLDEVELAEVLDDAQSFSLFAANRLIWVSGAEAALPRGRAIAAASEDDDEGGGSGKGKDGASGLSAYLRNPAPGTVLVFNCSRYDLEGEDKARVDRVRKFYSGIQQVVEFAHYTPELARRLAGQLAKERGVRIGPSELELLTEVLAGDAQRIANEIEKLALYAGRDRAVTEEDIWNLTPNAKASTIFALVNAVARRDRAASLESLDVLVREGEYLPLALSFLATQFRLALVAREAKLTNANQIQSFFQKQGTAMWRSRAEQVAQTATAFSAGRLKKAIVQIYDTDKSLRDTRPDDRTVMEKFVMELTGTA